MKLSYWELDSWLNNIDICIVGSGIVGLSAAYYSRKKYPNANIIILERGFLPSGASTKNAGFACFGSISELLADRKTMSEDEIFTLVEKRWKGLLNLRKLLGDQTIRYENTGGYEIFKKEEKKLFEKCTEEIPYYNKMLKNIVGNNVYEITDNSAQFNTHNKLIKNNYEAQIDTGKMMKALLQLCRANNIEIFNGVQVTRLFSTGEKVDIEINHSIVIKSQAVILATNGFAKKMFPHIAVNPARAQVLITEPINKLHFSGTFHYDEGYYYFRNVGNRILLGGGRNIDFAGETTDEIIITQNIQQALDNMLHEVIMAGRKINVEMRWAGIMGVGSKKEPMIQEVEKNIWVAVRMGGMGVAIGTLIGKEVAQNI